MKKFIFDSNIFDKIVDGEVDLNDLQSEDYKYFATHIQIDELNKTTEEIRKNRLLDKFYGLSKEDLPTESFVLGFSRLGQAKLGNGGHLEKLRMGNLKHTKDALIGEVSIKNNLVLVTEDEGFRKRVIKLNSHPVK